MVERRKIVLGVLILIAFWLNVSLYIKYKEKKKIGTCKDCNVILISIDTLAAKHLPCYGYDRDTAPNLCKFAKDNIYFPNSYSNSHWTLPSHMSIFTGLYPSTHGVQQILKDKLNNKYETLAQLLKNNGYKTIYAGPVDDPYLPLDLGIGRGFDDLVKTTNGASIGIDFWDEALDKFKKYNSENIPTFMFLHTYAVHDPYLPKDKQTYQFIEQKSGTVPKKIKDYYYYSPEIVQKIILLFEGKLQNSDTPESIEKNTKILTNLKKYSKEDNYDGLDNYLLAEIPEERNSFFRAQLSEDIVNRVDYYRDLYDECIYDLDGQLKKIFDLVKDGSISNKTIIIITSDHGEAFWEHGEYGHSYFCPDCLYNETVNVPMIMYVPNIGSKKINGLMQGVDIYPTLVEMLMVQQSGPLDGRSMAGQIYGKFWAKKNNYTISESELGTPQKTIIDKKWKLIWKYDQESSNTSLYNLTIDPGEKNNVASENLTIVENRIKILEDFKLRLNIDKSNSNTEFPSWIDKSTREKLIKSGYF